MRLKNTLFLALWLLSTHSLRAQATTIKLQNPSFEDGPGVAHTPEGWFDCGFAGETPPDIHPCSAFNVTLEAAHGDTYLGMVTRDNGTCEGIGQKLKTPLLSDTCYKMRIYLARSPILLSGSRLTSKEVNYISPTKLRIWSGMKDYKSYELLAQSPVITNEKWTEYTFILKPKNKAHYILLEAYYADETKIKGNGNIMLDNASDIVPCACTEPKY